MNDMTVEKVALIVRGESKNRGDSPGEPVHVTVELRGLRITPQSGTEKVFTWVEVFRKLL